jgi:ABC-type transport system substrate-binding protein
LLLGTKNLANGSWNMANYAPPAVDTLIAQGIASTNPAARLSAYTRLLERVASDVPYVPIYNVDATAAISAKFTWSRFNDVWYARPWALEVRARA